MSKLFSYGDVVKCRRNLNLEKMDNASYTGRNDSFIYLSIYLYLTNNLTNLQFAIKGRIAIYRINTVRLIKVKSKVNVNVTQTL